MKNIFVSSTFRDSHYERDALMHQVRPALNAAAREYGEYVNFCDLRWGIDTSEDYEESAGKILSICLDEIDRSRPNMIVLLGERYGYMPGEKLIAHEADRRKMALKELEISVTQLEIEYGALSGRKDLEHVWFYFREIEQDMDLMEDYRSENEIYYKKLDDLKKRIQNIAYDRVRFYKVKASQLDQLDEFVNMVKTDLLECFNNEWETMAKMTVYEKDNYHQWQYLTEKEQYFYVGQDFAERMVEKLEQQTYDSRMMVLTGEAGSGKSTCFSRICKMMQDKGWDILPFFCGNTSVSSYDDGILKSLIWHMETLTNSRHLLEEIENDLVDEQHVRYRLQKHLLDLYQIYSRTGRRLLIGIDAVNQLAEVKGIWGLPFIPDDEFKNIRFLLTCTNQVQLPGSLNCFEIPPLNKDDRMQVADRVLGKQGKQLARAVVQSLLAKESSANPLFLYMAINRLCLMDVTDFFWIQSKGGSIHEINERQVSLIQSFPDDLNQMSSQILYHIAERMQIASVIKCIEYMAVSRYGLRSSDLEDLLQMDGEIFVPLHFSMLINYLQEMFILRNDGRYDFMHLSLREGVLDRITDVQAIHDKISKHLLSLDEKDPIRQQELVYHLIQAKKNQELIEYIVKIGEKGAETSYAAESLYCQCMFDDGQWLKEMAYDYLSQDNYNCAFGDFMCFFEEQSGHHFFESPEGIGSYQSILEFAIPLLEKKHQVLRNLNTENKAVNAASYVLHLTYIKVGESYEFEKRIENLEKAYCYYKKAEELASGQWIKDYKNDKSINLMTTAYMHMGDIAANLGYVHNINEAWEHYWDASTYAEIALKINANEQTRKSMALTLKGRGRLGIYEKSIQGVEASDGNLKLAEDMLRDLVKENPSYVNWLEMVDILLSRSQLLLLAEDSKSACKLCEEAVRIAKDIHEQLHSLKSTNCLIDAYLCLGRAYESFGDRADYRQAFKCYDTAQSIAYKAEKDNQSTTISERIIESACCLGQLAVKTEDKKQLWYAVGACEEAHKLAYEMTEKSGSPKSIMQFIKVVWSGAEVQKALGEKQSVQGAWRLYQYCLQLIEHFSSHESEMIGMDELRYKSLKGLGHLYIIGEAVQNIEKGIQYLEKAMGIIQKMAGESGVRNVQWELAGCYMFAAEAWINTETEVGFSKSIEYFRQALAIRQVLDKEHSTLYSKCMLMEIYAVILMLEAGTNDLENENLHFGQMLNVGEAILKEEIVLNDAVDVIEALWGIAEDYENIDEEKWCHRYTKCYQIITDFYEKALGHMLGGSKGTEEKANLSLEYYKKILYFYDKLSVGYKQLNMKEQESLYRLKHQGMYALLHKHLDY